MKQVVFWIVAVNCLIFLWGTHGNPNERILQRKIAAIKSKHKDIILKASLPSKQNEKEVLKLRQEISQQLDTPLQIPDAARSEVKAISDSISKAVETNTYINNFPAPDALVIKLNASSEATKNLESPLLTSTLDHTQPPSTTRINNLDVPISKITINIVDSQIVVDLIKETDHHESKPSAFHQKFFKETDQLWHPSLPEKSVMYREILKLNSIHQNFNFSFNENVEIWKTVKKQTIDGKHALIGMTETGLILVSEKNQIFTLEKTIVLKDWLPNCFDVFTKWDKVEKEAESIVVVSVKHEIIFYNITTECNDLIEVWRWNLNKNISFVKYFRFGESDMLILVTKSNGSNNNPNGIISADIYQFELDNNQFGFWLFQYIHLKLECNNVATLNTGRDFLLGFPQNNTVVIYNSKNTKGKFIFFMEIKSDMVTSISGFSMGGYSYMAVGGRNSTILRYHRGQLLPQTILSSSFGLVENWFPVSARSHRDDLLLIVQHRVLYSTHSLSVLEILIWNGEAFNTIPYVPCYRETEITNLGVTCMIDVERDAGILGGTVIQQGSNISLLIPRKGEPSGFFNLNITLIPVNDPLYDDIIELESMFGILVELIEDVDNSLIEIQNAISSSTNVQDEYNVITGDWTVENIKTDTVFIDTELNTTNILIDGKTWINDDFDLNITLLNEVIDKNDEKLERLINQNSVKIKRQIVFNDQENSNEEHQMNSLIVDDLDVSEINFEYLNDIPANELVFLEDNVLVLEGDQSFENPIFVDGSVVLGKQSLINGISFKNDIVHMESEKILPMINCDSIEVEDNLDIMENLNKQPFTDEKLGRLLDDENDQKTITAEEMTIDGSLNMSTINGINFEHFIQQIVLKNLGMRINNIQIIGNVFTETDITVNYLNGLIFPENFLQVRGQEQSTITAYKNFVGKITTNAIDTDGTINNINPFEIITLSGTQYIPGQTTFSHIQVSDSLDVNGTISGRHLDNFLSNPSLLQSNIINVSCSFYDLDVEGPIYIQNTIDNINLNEVLTDVVYQDTNDFIEITSFKTFKQIYIENEFEITSKLINNKMELNRFITTDTDQVLEINNIIGNIWFDSLKLDGLFDFINVTELDEKSIKIIGDQYIGGDLVFQNNDRIDFETDVLQIESSINNIPIDEYVMLSENIELYSNVEIEHLEILNLGSNKGIGNCNSINSVNLNNFDSSRFSLIYPQTITSPFTIKTAIVNGDFSSAMINEINMKNFNKVVEESDQAIDDIFSGKVPIDRIEVNGNVFITMINRHDFNEIADNAVWLNRPNEIKSSWTFLDDCRIDCDIELEGDFNHINAYEFFDEIVLRNSTVVIDETKIFSNGFNVDEDIQADSINNIDIDDILQQNQSMKLKSDLIVNGNVQINHLISNKINNHDISDLSKIYSFDNEQNSHILNCDMEFVNQQQMYNLIVNGSLNDIFNLQSFLKDIIRRESSIHVAGTKIFTKPITILKNLKFEIIDNKTDVVNFVKNVVHINEPEEAEIEGNLQFTKKIDFQTGITIRGDLVTDNIGGVDSNEWIEHGLLTNKNQKVLKPIHFGPDSFMAYSMFVKFINGIDMSELVTVDGEQHMNGTLEVNEITVSGNVIVGGLVNYANLNEERANTMKKKGFQIIESPLIIRKLNITESLRAPIFINHKDTRQIAVIQPEMTFFSPIEFQQLHLNSVLTFDRICGIDFEYWYQQSLWKKGRSGQVVSSKWIIENVKVTDGISGNGLINNEPVNQILDKQNQMRMKIIKEMKQYHDYFIGFCHNLKYLINLSKNSIHFLRYFIESYIIEERFHIESTFNFKLNKQIYLLLNGDCKTALYKWNVENSNFHLIGIYETGNSNDWRSVSVNQSIRLMSITTKTKTNCKINGIHLWDFNGTYLEHFKCISNISSNGLSIYSTPKFPSLFYVLYEDLESVIIEYDQNGNKSYEWSVPYSNKNLRFLPKEINIDLGVTDGRQIFVLNRFNDENKFNQYVPPSIDNTYGYRKKRTVDKMRQNLENMKLRYSENFENLIKGKKLFKFGVKDMYLGKPHTIDNVANVKSVLQERKKKFKIGKKFRKFKLFRSDQEIDEDIDDDMDYGGSVYPTEEPVAATTSKITSTSSSISTKNDYVFGPNTDSIYIPDQVPKVQSVLDNNELLDIVSGFVAHTIDTVARISQKDNITPFKNKFPNIKIGAQSSPKSQFSLPSIIGTLMPSTGIVGAANDNASTSNSVLKNNILTSDNIPKIQSFTKDIVGLAIQTIGQLDDTRTKLFKISQKHGLLRVPQRSTNYVDNKSKTIGNTVTDGVSNTSQTSKTDSMIVRPEQTVSANISQDVVSANTDNKTSQVIGDIESSFVNNNKNVQSKGNTEQNVKNINNKTSPLMLVLSNSRPGLLLNISESVDPTNLNKKTSQSNIVSSKEAITQTVTKHKPNNLATVSSKPQLNNSIKTNVENRMHEHSKSVSKPEPVFSKSNQISLGNISKLNFSTITEHQTSQSLENTEQNVVSNNQETSQSITKPQLLASNPKLILPTNKSDESTSFDIKSLQMNGVSSKKEISQSITKPNLISNSEIRNAEPIAVEPQHFYDATKTQQNNLNKEAKTSISEKTPVVGAIGVSIADIYPKIEALAEKGVDRAINVFSKLNDLEEKYNSDNKIGIIKNKDPNLGISISYIHPRIETIAQTGVGREINNLNDIQDKLNKNKEVGDAIDQDVGRSLYDIYPKLEDISENLIDKAVKLIAKVENYTNPQTNEIVESTQTGNTNKTKIKYGLINDSLTSPHIISQVIPLSNIITTENHYIPAKGDGEIVILKVGHISYRRVLIAVSSKRHRTLPGKHDFIHIYDDILEGKIYQSLAVSKPSGLTAIHLRDETILAFLEGNTVIQLYKYRGIEGFSHFEQYKLPVPALHLTSISLPRLQEFSCWRHFLLVTASTRMWFFEAIMEGDCGIDLDLDCN